MPLEPYNLQINNGTHHLSHHTTKEWLQSSWQFHRRACICRRPDIRVWKSGRTSSHARHSRQNRNL